jgi:subtilase family serine protease
MKQLRRVVRPFVVVVLLYSPLPALSQKPEPRLKQAIAETARVALPNSRNPQAQAAEDLGNVAPGMAVPGITLVFARSAAQEAGLQQLLAAQQDTASPLYHRWLTPETFAARFGAADQDIAATDTWLQSRGFRIDSVARNRNRITFSGTAAQVQAAFGTELHHYRTATGTHFAPASGLTLPTDLASVTAAVLHLSDFRPKPNLAIQARPRPDFTALSTQAHYLGPNDIATMYDLSPIYQKNFYGLGQGLAVVGQSYVNLSEIETFLGALTRGNGINTVIVPGSGVEAISPGDEGESDIDLEYSSGIAQNATIFLVYVGDNQNYSVFDSLAFAITENIAPVVSISYGDCESQLSQSDLNQQNALFEEAAAQGQTIVASAGDLGSVACLPYTASQGVTTAQQQALAVNFPASSPYVTAVGGTQMAPGTFTAGANSYWSGAANFDSTSSLLSYVPEVVWNESSAALGIAASGGGASAVFPRPAWQTGVPGIAGGATRLLPDLALQSSVQNPGFLICTDDPYLLSSNNQTSSCVDGLADNNHKYTTEGGTSFAAPIFAGFVAILNQIEQTNGQGNLNPILYRLASNPATYAAAFHDITSGSSACPSSLSNCPAAGQSSYAATTGYDEATGLGSVDFNALAQAWPASAKPGLTATVTSFSSPGDTVAGATLSIEISVSSIIQPGIQPGGETIPTGTVAVAVDGVVVSPALATSPDPASFNTIANYNFVAPATSGSHLIAATYSGDATHAPSTATYAILVGNVAPTGSLTLAVPNLTTANGASGTTQVTITPSGSYSGRLVWSLSIAGGTTAFSGCYQIAPIPVSNTTTTQLTIGVGTACNLPFTQDRRALRPLNRLASAIGRRAPSHRPGIPATAVYACLLFCGLFATRRRRTSLPLLLTLLVLIVAGAGLTGCGGSGSGTSGGSGSNPGTPSTPSSTNYTVTLQGTDSVNTSINALTSFTLTVN